MLKYSLFCLQAVDKCSHQWQMSRSRKLTIQNKVELKMDKGKEEGNKFVYALGFE